MIAAPIEIKKIKNKLSRRGFLKIPGKIGLAGIGASLFYGSTQGKAILGYLDEKILIEYGIIDDILLYGEDDFRNIKIAEGIERICYEVNDLKTIASIHELPIIKQ